MRHFLLPALIPALFLCACYQPVEGCLDVAALNYNVNADDNCCCTYPLLRMQVQHRMDSLVWQRDSVYRTPDGQPFRLLDAAFYLSEFSLRQNNALAGVDDRGTFSVFGTGASDTSQQNFVDDFTLLRRTTVDLPVGTFSAVGTFDRVVFRLGLTADANRIIPSLAPTGHPLRPQSDSLWLNEQSGYVPLYLVLDRDAQTATPPDTLRFLQTEIGDAFAAGNDAFYHENGFDFVVKVRIDYTKLFTGVNLSAPDINAIRTGIAANLPAAFSVLP